MLCLMQIPVMWCWLLMMVVYIWRSNVYFHSLSSPGGWTIPLSVFKFHEVLPGFEFRIRLKDLVATTQYCESTITITIQDCVAAVVRYSLLVPCHVTDP